MIKKTLISLLFLNLYFACYTVEFKPVVVGDEQGIEAYEDGTCVGKILYVIGYTGNAYISKLHVETKVQKKGIGTQLLKKALEDLKARIIRRVTLIPYSFTKEIPRTKLIAFYERFGFVLEHYDRDWMSLELQYD